MDDSRKQHLSDTIGLCTYELTDAVAGYTIHKTQNSDQNGFSIESKKGKGGGSRGFPPLTK